MATQAPSPFSGTLKLATYPNRFNTVVPPEGPFYRTGLKLTSTGSNPRPLTEGLDYYLCYYFKEAAEALQDQIFGGIMLLTETEVNYTINSVGREYRVPQSEIGKFLVSQDMKDPRNVDWSSLMRYAPVVAPIDPPANLDEAILRDDVVKALDDIRKGIIARAGDMDTAYAEVTDLIFENGKKIFDDNLYQHHLIKNAHEYTAEEIGALKVLQKAVDSTKAFGRTIDQLVDIMKTNGISQTHIDTLLPVVLGELRGRMRVLDNGALTFRTSDSSHVITLQGDKFLITTTKPLNLTADADNNDPGIAVEVTAGYNAMYVASGAQAPIFNGAYLITPDMVSLYLSSVKLQPANAYFQSTDSVKIYGNGKDYAPVNMSTVVDTADTTKPGLILITSVSSNISSGAAISQAAVTALKTTLDNYVDNTYTVNGKGFVITTDRQELTLTPSDIGLGNINNTSPRQKPLTTAILNVLKNKALKTHTHTFADLTGVPTASDTTAGLVQLWDAIDITTDKVVTSKQGYNVQQRLTTLKSTVNQLLPAWTAGGSAFGNPGFLPIPAVGNYAGYMKRLNSQAVGVVKIEGDTIYALRNANDGMPNTDGIYYAYAQLTPSQVMTGQQQTSMLYQPEGMKAYGNIALTSIVINGDDAIMCRGSDNKYYLIMLDGTLNPKKHTRIYQCTFPTGLSSGGTSVIDYVPNLLIDTLLVYKDKVFIHRLGMSNTDFWTYMFKSVIQGTSVVFSEMVLTGGVGKTGILVNLRSKTDVNATDPATTGLSFVTEAGKAKWTGSRNITHGSMVHHATAIRNTTLRVGINGGLYLSNNDTSYGFTLWPTSYTIDMETGVVTLENPEMFPLRIDADGVYYATGEEAKAYGQPERYPYARPNDRARAWSDKPGRLLTFFDASDQVYPAGIAVSTFQGEFFDYLEAHNKSGRTDVSSWSFSEGVGSVFKVGHTHPVYLGNNAYLFSPVNSNSAIYVEVDPLGNYGGGYGGAGPTNNRRTFDITTYYKLANMPWCAEGTLQSGKLNGAYWTTYGNQNYQALGDTPTADQLSISQTEWNKLISTVKTQAPAGAAYDGINSSGQVYISLWAIRPKDAVPIWIAQATAFYTVGGVKKLGYYFFQVYPTVTGNVVSFPLTTLDLIWGQTYDPGSVTDTSITSYHGHNSRMGQPFFYEQVSGTGFLHIPNFLKYTTVGGAGSKNLNLNFTITSGKMTAVDATAWDSNHYYSPTILAILNEKLVRVNQSYISPAYASGPAAPITDFISNGSGYWPTGPTEIIAGVKTAEGWNFYITEAISWRIGSNYYTTPAYNVDLKATFPGNYQNRVFHVHVQLVGNTPQYQLLSAPLADTDTRLYLGTITTDSSRIVDTQLRKVKRMGNLKQLIEHAANAYEHDVDVAVELKQSPLGLLKKEPLRGDIGAPGYFDSSKLELMVTNQKRKDPLPALKFTPKVFALTDTTNRAPDFYPAPTATLATASENATAAAASVSWIGFNTPVNTASFSFVARPLVTPTKGQLRVKVYMPAAAAGTQTSFRVNGTALVVKHGQSGTATMTVTAGTRIAVEISANFSSANRTTLGNKLFGFAIYDWDGTTETLLVSSDASTPLIFSAMDNSLENMVFAAEAFELGVSPNDYMAYVSCSGSWASPPTLLKGTQIIVATKWVDNMGLHQASDLAVNLMPKL